MPFVYRHETPGLLTAYGDVAELAGRRQAEAEQQARDRENELQERQMDLQARELQSQNQQFYDRLDAQEQAWKRRHQERIELQDIAHQQNLEEMQFKEHLRTGDRMGPVEFEFTPEQRRQEIQLRQALQDLEQADHLRPDEKRVMREQIYDQLFSMKPIPKLPEQKGPAPVKKELDQRVYPTADGSGFWVLQEDGGLSFEEKPKIIEPADFKGMYETAIEMFTTVSEGKQSVDRDKAEEYVQQVMIPMYFKALGKEPPENFSMAVGPQGQRTYPTAGTKGPGRPAPGVDPRQQATAPQGQQQVPAQEQPQSQYDLSKLPPDLRPKVEKRFNILKSQLEEAKKNKNKRQYNEIRQQIEELVRIFFGGQ